MITGSTLPAGFKDCIVFSELLKISFTNSGSRVIFCPAIRTGVGTLSVKFGFVAGAVPCDPVAGLIGA